MPSYSRRQLLATAVVGSAALTAGGYWQLQDGATDCPERIDPVQEFTRTGSTNVWSRPVVRDRTVFVAAGTGITSMSATSAPFQLLALESGNDPKWLIRREAAAGLGVPEPVGDRVVVSSADGTLFAVDRSTGWPAWEFDAKPSAGGSIAPELTAHDGIAVAMVTQPTHDAFTGSFALGGFSIDDGTVEWTTELDSSASHGLTTIEGTLVASRANGTVIGVNPSTGERLWTTTLDGSIGGVKEIGSFAGLAWLPRADGLLVGLDPETGTVSERLLELPVDQGDGFLRAIETGEGSMIVGDATGTVVSYDTELTERWQYDGPAPVADIDTRGDRVGVIDQRGVYYELDERTGDRLREVLLVGRGSGCGLDASRRVAMGLAAVGRSIVVTGRPFGTSIYRLSHQQ